MEGEWKTEITDVAPNKIRIRGYAVEDLMAQVSFADAVFLTLIGRLPDQGESRLVNAILVSSIDHGVTPPSVLAALHSASTGAPMNAALAAGILSINQHHGGAIENCMHLLDEAVQLQGEEESPDPTALEIIRKYREAKKRLPGFGHRLHTADPRSTQLIRLADETGKNGRYVEMARTIESTLQEESGKVLPLNVDGAIAAVLLELGVPKALGNQFFILSRVPGLIAHIHEEQTRQKPMRKFIPDSCHYDGPEPKPLNTEA
ncbi:citryl-CoA lyase [candidate division KSB1 bacterium]|nr:citryl-CoA lyase [candidate division KSB1 bacterium]